MKTTRFLLAGIALGLLLVWQIPRALALTVTEPPDFPNDAASAATYVLDMGANSFSGKIINPNGNLDADYFKVTVLPGQVVTAIGTSGSASTGLTAPLYAGTYHFSVNVLVLPNSELPWGFTFTVAAAPDYEVSTTGGQIVLHDRSGYGGTLTLSEPFASTIKFAAPGRTFSVDGGAYITGDSGSFLPFNDISNPITSVTVNTGAGSDTIQVGDFSRTAAFPSLTISSGAGVDVVNFTGDVTFGSARSLSIVALESGTPTMETVNVAADANVRVTGASASQSITISCARSVSVETGGSLESTAGGNVTVTANAQATPATGDFIGVRVNGGTIGSASGTVAVTGRGGNAGGGGQLGVEVTNGGKIATSAAGGTIHVVGTGGDNTGLVNRGVTVYGAGSEIRAGAADVNVTGTGGPNGGYFGIGVSVLFGGVIAGGSSGTVTVTGTGAGSGGFNMGIELGGSGSAITSSGGHIVARGSAGIGGDSVGIYLATSAAISTPVAGGNVTLRTDSLAIDSTSAIATADAASRVTLGQRHPDSVQIDLGGANPAGKFSLTDAVLDRITTSDLVIGVDSTTAVLTSANVSPANAGTLALYAGAIFPTAAGTDVTLDASRTLKVQGTLAIPVVTNTPGTGYPQLIVAGQVNLTSALLSLAGTIHPGVPGSTFTIVENDGSDSIVGTFSGLPDGGALAWPASVALYARISYTGGSGNDVVLTLHSALEVTNTNPSGPGSLASAVAYARIKPGADTIDFAPWLSGQTIVFAGQLVLDDADGVTVDATALPGGVTVSGNGAVRVFAVNPGKTATLRGLTITGGSVPDFISGGAIFNSGTLTLTRCTLFGNSAAYGGAIYNDGTLTLTQCTLAGNTATVEGTVLYNFHAATLTHCTVSGNSSPSPGTAAIHNDEDEGFLTLNYCIVAGNTPHNLGGFPFEGANNLTSGDPLLAPLGDYGGSTQTMALKPGSPARDAATGSAITSDQRGQPIVGTPDIGAYEAGLPRNYAAWNYETLPAAATLAQRDPGFDFDGDSRLNVLEYATFTDGAVPGGSTGTTLVRQPDGSEARFTFTLNAFATDLLYELQRSLPGVGPWVTIGDVNLRTGLIHNYGVGVTNTPSLFSIEFRDPGIAGQPKAFYRLRACVP